MQYVEAKWSKEDGERFSNIFADSLLLYYILTAQEQSKVLDGK